MTSARRAASRACRRAAACWPRGEGRALLEMQIGDDQRVLARPVERAGHVCAERSCRRSRRPGRGNRRSVEALRFQARAWLSSSRPCHVSARWPRAIEIFGGLAQQVLACRAETGSWPISSRIGTDSGDTLSKRLMPDLPLMRRRNSPRRAMSSRPVAASAQAASSRMWRGIVAAQHVVDEVGRHGDLAAGSSRCPDGGARSGRR